MKRFYYLLCTFFFCCLPFALTSCSSDDDEEGGSAEGSATAGQVSTTDGETLYITQVGDNVFSYDDKGKIAECKVYGSDVYNFSYNPFKISRSYQGNGYTDNEEYTDISVNGKGAITSMKEYFDYTSSKNEDENESGNGNLTCSYDGSGHLVSMKVTGTSTYKDDGKTVTEKSSLDYSFTWTDGKLMKIVCTSVEDGERDVETVTFEYGDNAQRNVTKQWTDCFFGDCIEEMEWLFYLGYFGVAGDYHPTGATQVDSDGTTERFVYETGLNTNGSVNYTRYKYNSNYWNNKRQYSYQIR